MKISHFIKRFTDGLGVGYEGEDKPPLREVTFITHPRAKKSPGMNFSFPFPCLFMELLVELNELIKYI